MRRETLLATASSRESDCWSGNMAEALVAGVAVDFAISAAIAGLGNTIRAIMAVYTAGPKLQENLRVVAELERILAFLGPALQHINARAAQFASASLPALGNGGAAETLHDENATRNELKRNLWHHKLTPCRPRLCRDDMQHAGSEYI